jgi:dipeptidyl-peptidase 4
VQSFYLVPLLGVLVAPAAADKPLVTVAEKSDYRATSRHADVMAFCEELARRSPLVKLGRLGVSGEGRELPLLLLSDPPVATPAEAAKSGKLVVIVIGNIHAGEVDGKEALLMLARDLTTAAEHPLLKDLVLAICPLFNADGNEPISRANRTEQVGPVEGVGIRENALGYDLNRDFVKLETPEVRALVRFFNEWDPALFIDTHTTNGSYHRYLLTYDGPRHPAVPDALVELVRDRLLPDAGKRLEKSTGFHSFFYGNFEAGHTLWETYPAEPRYGVQYYGLRDRLSILSESYSYATFRERVLASYGFVRACLESTDDHRADIRALLKPGTPAKTVPIRTKAVPLNGTWKALGYVEKKEDGKRIHPTEPKEFTLQYLGKCESRLSVSRPFAYLIPASYSKAIDVLRRHGVAVEELSQETAFDAEIYRIDKVNRSTSRFQFHSLVKVDATPRAARQTVPAGTVVVRTDQHLGTLAVILLEPQCEDGLTTWNFFDAGLTEGSDFPVLRLPNTVALSTRPLAQEKR